jgi:hypothetical protein
MGAVQSGASTASAPAGPPEFASITTTCLGVPEVPPAAWSASLVVTVYNLPSSANPNGFATISSGGTATSVVFGSAMAAPNIAGAYVLSASVPGLSGKAVSISVSWNDGAGGSGTLGPQLVGMPGCGQLPGEYAPPQVQYVAMAANPTGSGYWEVTNGGYVASFPNQYQSYGDLRYLPLNAPIVGIAATPDGDGYWLVGADGGVFSFGTARFFGSTGSLRLNAPIVGIAATPDGGGYWLVARDGGIFAYGDAPFYGSMGGDDLNDPVVGMAVDQTAGGYWLVASDGGVFSFDAPFHGSAGNLVLHSPVVGMQAAPDGSGYRLAARDGGIFSYDLPFAGSYAGQDPDPMSGITGQGATGYWLVDACGGVYSFGSAQFHGAAC